MSLHPTCPFIPYTVNEILYDKLLHTTFFFLRIRNQGQGLGSRIGFWIRLTDWAWQLESGIRVEDEVSD